MNAGLFEPDVAVLSPNRLLALSQIGDRLMSGVFRDPQDAYEIVVRSFHELIEAETSALFIMREDAPGQLDLKSIWPKPPQGSKEPLAIPVSKLMLANADGLPPGGPPYDRVEFNDNSGWVRVPLMDRKNKLLGQVLLSQGRQRGAPQDFSKEDIVVAALLAQKAAGLLENVRTFRLLRDLKEAAAKASGIPELLESALRTAVRLLHADRGDTAYHDWNKGDLVVGPQNGPEVLNQWPPGTVLPKNEKPRGLIRKVWETGADLIIPRVSEELDYLPGHPDTKSEIVVLLRWNKRRLGVINLESFRASAFDEPDLCLLRLVADYVVDAYLVGQAAEFKSISGWLAEHRHELHDLNEIATRILESVRAIYGFDCGIIYRPDYAKKEMEGYAAIPRSHDLKSKPFCYGFDESSLASHVFKTRQACFIQDPGKDPEKIVNPRGVEYFNIKSPLLGIPLLVETEPVGVMVVWSDLNLEQAIPTREHIELLEPFARLAAVLLRGVQAETRRSIFLDGVERILKQMQTEIDLRKNLQAIMEEIQRVGFDRVRVFELKYSDSMVPLCSLGMGEHESEFMKCVQMLDQHPYATDLINDVQRPPTSGLLARVYPREQDLGKDPDAEKLGKSPGLPWVDVPLISASKLYGEIAADNLVTRREIGPDDKEYLSFFGALAARAFAIAEERGTLKASTMTTLYNQVWMEEHRDVLLRCLLRYLTHGEGLGFSRALFLELEKSTGRMVFAEGVGSLTWDRFTKVARETREMSLEDVLTRAHERSDDDQLYKPLRGLRLDWRDERVQRWLKTPAEIIPPEAAEWPCTDAEVSEPVQELRRRLDSNHFLAALARADGEKVLGVFVVDRRWQPRQLGAADRAVLSTFAKRAAQILMHHDLQRQIRELSDQAHLGMLTQGLTHELRHPLGALRKDTYTLLALAEGKLSHSLSSSLERISRNVVYLVDTVDRLQALVRPHEGREATDIESLLENVYKETQERFSACGIMLRPFVQKDLPPIQAIPALLTVALKNLIANAERALAAAKQADKTIKVIARRKGDTLVLEVGDNGPGIPADILERVRQPGSGFTSNLNTGLGLGLAIVRRVAQLHEGTFDLQSQPGRGTRAILAIPLMLKGATDAAQALDR
jgi:signal transduction histidine kinase/putative methionine-R-sulfoxide reductase with GAF domain